MIAYRTTPSTASESGTSEGGRSGGGSGDGGGGGKKEKSDIDESLVLRYNTDVTVIFFFTLHVYGFHLPNTISSLF